MKQKNNYFTAIGCAMLLGLSTAAHSMGRIPKKEYQGKVAELEQTKKDCAANEESLRNDLAQAQLKAETLETANAQLLKDMDSSKDALQKRVSDLTKEKQEIEKQKAAEVGKLKSTYDSLVLDMKKEIDQGSIQITQLQNKLSVNLVDKILFNSGEAEVNEQGKQVLKKVANVLKKVQNKQIRIEGHTDNVPIGGSLKEKYPSNWELSTARATNVTRYLQEIGGIEPQYLFVAGYAHYRSIADNSTPEGRSKNRRIEIALVPAESETPPAQTTQANPK